MNKTVIYQEREGQDFWHAIFVDGEAAKIEDGKLFILSFVRAGRVRGEVVTQWDEANQYEVLEPEVAKKLDVPCVISRVAA